MIGEEKYSWRLYSGFQRNQRELFLISSLSFLAIQLYNFLRISKVLLMMKERWKGISSPETRSPLSDSRIKSFLMSFNWNRSGRLELSSSRFSSCLLKAIQSFNLIKSPLRDRLIFNFCSLWEFVKSFQHNLSRWRWLIRTQVNKSSCWISQKANKAFITVATARLATLVSLLCRWRGSVMKLIWKDLIIYLLLFLMIELIYTFILNESGKLTFQQLVEYFKVYEDAIPLGFILGFFVSNVMTRWWDQYQCIPWPYAIAVYVSSTIHGYDEIGRAMRRTIMRYTCKLGSSLKLF